MDPLDVLTINENPDNKEDLLEIIWSALNYFPEGIWGEINYVGNATMKCGLMIEAQDETSHALAFSQILGKLREMKGTLKSRTLLMGVTHDPVIVVYCRFEGSGFRRRVLTVHDYVSNDVGFLSFFRKDEPIAVKIVAHGLGHSQGLEHHDEPIDLMFVGLLGESRIKLDGFCGPCRKRLQNRRA